MPTTNQETERCLVPLSLAAPPAPQGGEEEGESRRRYRVQLIVPGRVLRRDGEEAPWEIPATTIQAAVTAGRFENLACFVDHAGWFDHPSLRNLCGVVAETEWTGRAAEGILTLYDSEPGQAMAGLLDQILADQMGGKPTPNVGGSLVFFGRHDMVDVGEKPGEEYVRMTREICKVESWDLVFGPAAEGRVKEALASLNVGTFERSPERSPNDVISAGSSPEAAERPAPRKGQISTFGGVTMDPEEVQTEQLNNETPATAGSALHTPPAAPATQAPQGDVLGALSALQQQVARLTAALGRQEEPSVVQGMGQPPREQGCRGAGVQGMRTGIERFAPNIDWLFGVPDAPYPDPQFRRADMIYQALTGDWEWRGVFNPERVMLAGVNSTDLPNLAVDAMNKVILLLWASLRAYRWYELVAAVVPNDGSTHDMTWIGTGGIEVLPVVAEKGTYTELSLADSKESDAFTKYGGYVGITLEMFRKSEIAKIQAVPLGLARSAVMKRSANIAAIFTANAGVGPTLDDDSKALFHEDHSNIATTAFGTDSTAWNAADLAIWSQAELGSAKPLAISPKYMLCNRALFRAALVVFGYGDGQPTTYVPEAMDRGADDPRPWPIAVPDFSDANDWAAIVDPKLYPVIMMSYAQQGQGGGQHPLPELYAVTNETQGLVFTNDTLPVKVRDWYAYGVNGYRGIAKRNVT